MLRRTWTVLLLVIVLTASGIPALAQDEDDLDPVELGFANAGACSAHAHLMLQACAGERRDDYLVHLADCEYTVPAEERRGCRMEARFERGETADDCETVYEARLELCDRLGEARYTPDFDPADFVDPDEIGDTVAPSSFWPLTAGRTHVVVADGELTVVTATDEVRDVGGLPCRVFVDLVFEEGEEDGEVVYEPIEATQDWYAQHENGDIVYCGENTYEIEDGLISNTDGSFAHGTDRALAGVLIRQAPVVGASDRQEMASGEAEDFIEYVSLATSPSAEEGGDSTHFPCNGGCLQTYEQNPRDPGGAEYKYYLPGTGFVLATTLDEDGEPTGEREEVTCIGDSLDVLDEAACGIADVDALREAMCLASPEFFCEE